MKVDWIDRANSLNLQVRDFLGGRWVHDGGSETIEKYSPRDGSLLYCVATGNKHRVDAAVREARSAFESGSWSRMSSGSRKRVLHKLASLIDEHLEELALLESLDAGRPISDAVMFDVPTAASIIRYCAEAAEMLLGKAYGADQFSLSYQLRRPVGVVAGIIGWNFPLVLAAQKVGPALAAGNSLVLKPSELTSLSAARIAELAVEAGVPPGVFNVVHGEADIGSALACHRNVNLLSFTGSSQTGKKMLIASGESNMKRLILECGGKSPNIVFDDCPEIGSVADAIVSRAFWNQGQVCTASSRLLVHESIKDELLEAVIQRMAAFRLGDPLEPTTRFGALVSRKHKEKVSQCVLEGHNQGARVVYQSSSPPPNDAGFYLPPVILDNVAPDQKLAQEEIFGPVLCVMGFRDEREAISMANNTAYGLSAIVWTKELSRAHRVTFGLESGWTVVNATGSPRGGFDEAISVGGHKESGIGTEGGIEGLEAYMNATAVQIFV